MIKKNLNEINIFLVFASENYSKHATRDVKMFESKTNNQIKTKTIKSVEISLLDYNEYVFICNSSYCLISNKITNKHYNAMQCNYCFLVFGKQTNNIKNSQMSVICVYSQKYNMVCTII